MIMRSSYFCRRHWHTAHRGKHITQVDRHNIVSFQRCLPSTLNEMSQPTSETESRPSTSAWKLNDIFEALQDINLEGKIEDQETEQLGLGSSSDIFRARYTAHNKIVAVKRVRLLLLDNIADARVSLILLPRIQVPTADSCFLQAIGREVRLWSKLNHPNVLPLLGYFLSGPKAIPNFVSEWMEKGTLTDYMKNRPFDVREMCEMVSSFFSSNLTG